MSKYSNIHTQTKYMMIGLYTLAAIQMYNAMQSIRKYGRLHLLLC